jgi:hypothetical protein
MPIEPRCVILRFRVSRKEFAAIARNARDAGMGISGYLRCCTVGGVVFTPELLQTVDRKSVV